MLISLTAVEEVGNGMGVKDIIERTYWTFEGGQLWWLFEQTNQLGCTICMFSSSVKNLTVSRLHHRLCLNFWKNPVTQSIRCLIFEKNPVRQSFRLFLNFWKTPMRHNIMQGLLTYVHSLFNECR